MFELESEVRDNANLMAEFTVEVIHFHHQPPHKGSPWSCDSSEDYYGYSDCGWVVKEWSVIDQDGEVIDCGEGDIPYTVAMSDQWITDHIIDMMLDV